MARVGRRRRVLNDEVRSAAGATAYEAFDPDAPRYGEQANIENHPQVTDLIPRRKLAVLATILAGVGTAAAATAIGHFAEPISNALPGVAASELRDGMAAGVNAWSIAVAMLMIAMMAKLTYSLRRHRVDDYAGRYRVWKWIGCGALAMSVNAVAPVHGLLAKSAVAATGWSLTSAGSEWWLAPLAIVGSWIFIRLVLEVKESRSTLAILLTAAACYGAATATVLGLVPNAAAEWVGIAANAMPLVGATFSLAASMVFARYVVLDVQGLIEHAPPQAPAKPAEKSVEKPAVVEKSQPKVATPASAPAPTPTPTPTQVPAPAKAAPAKVAQEEVEAQDDEWSGEDEDEDGYDNRKLSKADKKRLRRQNRAA